MGLPYHFRCGFHFLLVSCPFLSRFLPQVFWNPEQKPHPFFQGVTCFSHQRLLAVSLTGLPMFNNNINGHGQWGAMGRAITTKLARLAPRKMSCYPVCSRGCQTCLMESEPSQSRCIDDTNQCVRAVASYRAWSTDSRSQSVLLRIHYRGMGLALLDRYHGLAFAVYTRRSAYAG